MAPNMITAATLASMPRAKDLSQQFVPEFRVHRKSPFKAIMGTPTLEMINMAGGVPHPSVFPLQKLQATVKSAARDQATQGRMLTLDKHRPSGSVEKLDELLQYNDGRGMSSYCSFIRKHTQLSHSPQYSDWDVVASCGSGDAIPKVISLFCQAGDSVLVEQMTFPGMLASLALSKVRAEPVAMDSQGMLPSALDEACRNWCGATPLRAVYIIPTGQNPTGATMSLERRQEIYAVAQRHNLVIIEDDPYYFLQLGPLPEDPGSRTLAQPLPSLLSLDTDGRVIRLDSFSKILAPNLRCGWVTGPTYILDRVQILNESGILQPSGLSQGVISSLLNDTWGIEGWDAHLRGLREAYTARRNLFVAAAGKYLDGLAEFEVPQAGMYVWLKINLGPDPAAVPRLLAYMKKGGVMMAPGQAFCANVEQAGSAAQYLRAAFALIETDMFEPALHRLAQAIAAARVDGDETKAQSSACAGSSSSSLEPGHAVKVAVNGSSS
ncbi:hypothetical protein GGF46_002383 [Coemansia sp. RSA 552]|nr:hypothetical protein GGF46_002383 [Coemansia sp. RSA 552]